MKKFYLLTKTLLVAATLLLGGTNFVWADRTDLTTMTGVLGLTDNSTPAWTYYSKTATLKAGETYTYTFQNYTKGSSATAEYETWIAEIRENTTNYCLDARGDGGGWKWEPSTDNLVYNYSGKAWNDNGRSLSDFMTAYNGVTVTLTISSSADGKTVTIARSATLIDGTTDYSGTWTCSNFAGNDKTINLIAEASHQDITKVVYTNASGVVTTYERKEVDLSQFTGDFCSYNAGVVTFSVTGASAVQKWCTLDLSGYYSEIPGLITDVNMTLTENITCTSGDPNTGTNRLGIGIYGDTRESFKKPTNADRYNTVNWWGVAGKNGDVRIYYGNGNSYTNGLSLNADTKIDVLMNMSAKTFSWYQGGSQKVNGQSFYDNTITQPKYLAVQTWSTPVQATISDMSLEIVYKPTVATIGATGWTTFASPYALDLSGMTASTGSVTAYYASAIGDDKVKMTSTESTGVAAGEGLMLKGTVGATITIPVVGSGSAIAGNKLVGCTTSTVLTANENYFVLVNNGNDEAEFQSLADNGATIPAGKAYLNATGALARLSIVFDDATAIKAIDASSKAGAQADGKYLEKGKIVIVKNGVKFNANGQKVK